MRVKTYRNVQQVPVSQHHDGLLHCPLQEHLAVQEKGCKVVSMKGMSAESSKN